MTTPPRPPRKRRRTSPRPQEHPASTGVGPANRQVPPGPRERPVQGGPRERRPAQEELWERSAQGGTWEGSPQAGPRVQHPAQAGGHPAQAGGQERRAAATRERRTPGRQRERRAQAGTDDWSISWLEARGLSRRQQKLVVYGGSAAGLVLALAAFMFVVSMIGSDYVPEQNATSAVGTQPRPDSYQGWVSSKVFTPIARRADNSKPLTLKEVFGEKTLKEGRITLKLTDSALDTGCSTAVWGQALAQRLTQAGCLQAARGLYVSADGRYVAQYTLFNLRDVASAEALVTSLKTLHRGGWALALNSAAFPAGGYTEGSGHAMGHYAGLVWIGRADGAEPTAQDDFISLALTVRGVEKGVFRRVVAATPTSAPTR
ncbi:proline-rich domain-containing protein [Planobispora siamensis]|uniref:Uncharacterized protein n=1 Tax=Planobispora siamensis TaxID=936338 RepID=A0A8J3SME1_9ACTN|nr:proline-rich domain-containing protein [Planobispora siamensis]GIH94989.1 hypothetical protein Psi01_56190 [Planobispora siamensis]